MLIQVLGPMIVGDRGDVQLRDRALLGVLVVRRGSHVSTEDLAEAIWADRRPVTYKKGVHGSVARLRRELGEDAIATRGSGYSLGVDAVEIDAVRFEQLVDDAQEAIDRGDPRRAAAIAGEALRLWRGDPYPELPQWEPSQAEQRRLTELRETADDLHVEATLLSGRAGFAVARLEALAAPAPYREPRWALLARAQYAAGRQADALATLRELRRALGDDLGVDPSPEITVLETAILRHDPSLAPLSSVRSGRWLFSRAGRIAAAALLAVAVGGTAVGLFQLSRAEVAAENAAAARRTTEALRMGETASTLEDPSIALALAAESLTVDDSAAVRSRALDTLGNFAALLNTGIPPSAPWPEESQVVVSPDGRITATADRVVIQLVANGVPTHRLVTPTDEPTALAFSADGRYLAAGMSQPGYAETGSTVVWDVGNGAQVAVFDSGNGAVLAHVFASDGSSIWSSGEDGVHQWDLTASHALVRTDDGDPVLFRAGDIVLSVADASVERWIDYACALAGRPLTPEEWRDHVGDRPYAPTCG